MKRSRMIRNCLEYARIHGFDHNDKSIAYLSLKTKMRDNAICDNGISETFRFSEDGYDLILNYIQIEDKDIELYPFMFENQFDFKRISIYNQTNQDILASCLEYNKSNGSKIDGTLHHLLKEIKEKCAKKFNAVYSALKIDNINIYTDAIFIRYSYYSIKNEFIDKMNSDDVIFGEAPLPYGEWFIDYFGPYPKDRPRRKDGIALTKDVEAALNKGYIDCTPPAPAKNAIRYCSSDAMIHELLLKENKNMSMIVHLLIVPEGMNEEFVNNTKKNLQSDDSTTLYVSSNDIAFEPNDRYKTKYELFENWVKFNNIHCVEFMLGYENDPDAKAFESFIRGVEVNSRSSADTVTLWYQKDTIERAICNIRDDYVESSKAFDRLDNITDKIMDKVKSFKEYGLKDNDLDSIRNANSVKNAYFAAVNKITEVAFSSDKKGNKKK